MQRVHATQTDMYLALNNSSKFNFASVPLGRRWPIIKILRLFIRIQHCAKHQVHQRKLKIAPLLTFGHSWIKTIVRSKLRCTAHGALYFNFRYSPDWTHSIAYTPKITKIEFNELKQSRYRFTCTLNPFFCSWSHLVWQRKIDLHKNEYGYSLFVFILS